MGAKNSYHKRSNECLSLNHPAKMPRFATSSKAMAPRISRYPEAKSPLRREVHAPSSIFRFDFSSCARRRERETDTGYSSKQDSCHAFRNFLIRNYNDAKRNALSAFRYSRTDEEVIDVDAEPENVVVISDDDTSMEIELMENGAVVVNEREEKTVEEGKTSSEDREMYEGNVGVNSPADVVSNHPVTDVSSFEAYRKFLGSAKKRTSRLKELGFSRFLKERCAALLRDLIPLWKRAEEPVEEVTREPFIPLSKEEEAAVNRAFSANSWEVLVTHENSNIDIRGQVLRCLRPGEWLNDEVINLYLVLLKEREAREPKKFLKCHFFNTFFYKKLVSTDKGYNYNAVRRWTSPKRLGYRLIDCDKIFVPIHRNIHWTLAVINKKDQKLQYLDSFKGREPRILNAVARYFADEVRDKGGEDIDISSWKQEFVKDLPLQKNGYDCGMFMMKYIDFYSRGLNLVFSQEQMPYFRVRTAKEILQLKAD